MKKNSLNVKIWIYLAVFSLMILCALWVFQIMFLNTYYEYTKKKEISGIAKNVLEIYDNEEYELELDNLSFKENVCIEIISDKTLIYTSGSVGRGCIFNPQNKLDLNNYRDKFINGDFTGYKVFRSIDNKFIIYGIKLENGHYAFVSTSLQPIGATVDVLKNQLIYVTILVLGVSVIVAYFISKRISNPIIKLNEASKKMAKGNYDVVFETGDSIDEINELAYTLNQTSRELAKTEELRRELMANVSHDLKTPLTLIKANSEMIRDITIKDQKKSKEKLNIIIDEVDRLNLLVEDILELSEMQSKVTQLKKEKFDLDKLIKTVIQNFEVLEEKDGYKINYENKSKIMVYADQKKIEQVMYNLINNAINYTGKNKEVNIKLLEKENSFLVDIIDTGEGISFKDIKYIWDKYYKVDKSYKRVTHGTGLGLSIVKNILELHNFKYGVKTSKKGTTFYFEIDKA